MNIKMVEYIVHDHDDHAAIEKYIIFARTKKRADQIFHKLIEHDLAAAGWTSDAWDRAAKLGQAFDFSILQGDDEGLGIFDEVNGWSLVPPDWEG